MASLPRRIASRLNQRLRSPQTAAFVAGVESNLTHRRREQKMKAGAFRGLHVVVYPGFVADDVAKVRVRVLEAPELPGDSRIPYWDVAQSNLRRHAALRIVGAEVELSIGAHRATGITDRHGFATFSLHVPGLRAGWHNATAVVKPIADGDTTSGSGHIVKPSLKAPFLVISDIDDTVLLTGLTEGVAMLARTVLHEASRRSPIPGMASLYRGLTRGLPTRSGGRRPEPTFFYVSTGTWSFYPALHEFLKLRGFPQGPMFLTDWGPTERYLRRSGAEHKRTAIRRLFDSYPGMGFVLVGDSGQRDPLTYTEMAREHPGRVKLIIIRQVGSDDDERNVAVRSSSAALRAEGIPLHLVTDAVEAASIAHAAQLCDQETIAETKSEVGTD